MSGSFAQHQKGDGHKQKSGGGSEAAAIDQPDQDCFAEKWRDHAQQTDGGDAHIGCLYLGCKRAKTFST